MDATRRRFIRSSIILASAASLPPCMLSSCGSPGKEESLVGIDFIGDRESFDKYQEHFRRIRKNRFVFSSLETALSDGSDAVFLDTLSATKSAYIIMLMEQGKDILTTYPLAGSLGDYANISEFREEYGRIVGMLNPLLFYPSVKMLKDILATEGIPLDRIDVRCHPVTLDHGFRVEGPAGTAQPMVSVASYLSDAYPVILRAEAGTDGQPSLIEIRYDAFVMMIRFDEEQTGWHMKISGNDFSALADHTGLLAVNNEVESRRAPDPAVLEKATRDNLEDFMDAVRERNEPRVNILDGLSSIVLNKALGESLRTEGPISL